MVKKKIIKKIGTQTDFWEDSKSYIDIRNCSFGFKCSQKWGDLLKRKEKNVKYCHNCEKEVHLIETSAELEYAIKFNYCVAIKVRYDEIQQIEKPDITIGKLTPPDFDEPIFLRKKP